MASTNRLGVVVFTFESTISVDEYFDEYHLRQYGPGKVEFDLVYVYEDDGVWVIYDFDEQNGDMHNVGFGNNKNKAIHNAKQNMGLQ